MATLIPLTVRGKSARALGDPLVCTLGKITVQEILDAINHNITEISNAGDRLTSLETDPLWDARVNNDILYMTNNGTNA